MAEDDYEDTGLHQQNTWDQRNMTQTSTYNTGAPYTDAWIPSNAAAQNTDVNSQTGIISESEVFKGGYAGNCPTGQRWTYTQSEGRWECSGALQWSPPYFVHNVPSATFTGKGGIFLHKGIFVDSNIANAPEESFTKAWFQQNNEQVAKIKKVRWLCYAGPNQDKNLQTSTDTKTWTVPSTVSSTVFLPDDIGLSGQSKYTCQFEFLVDKPSGQSWEGSLGSPNELDASQARNQLNLESYIDSTGIVNDFTQVQNNLVTP